MRVFTNLSITQYAQLTKWCIANDRSMSYAISKALTDHLSSVTSPYDGEANIKVMSRTTPENASAIKERGGTGWRWTTAAIQEMLECSG